MNTNFLDRLAYSNDFIQELSDDLEREGANVDQVARLAIEKLQAFDGAILLETLDLERINKYSISADLKKRIAKADRSGLYRFML